MRREPRGYARVDAQVKRLPGLKRRRLTRREKRAVARIVRRVRAKYPDERFVVALERNGERFDRAWAIGYDGPFGQCAEGVWWLFGVDAGELRPLVPVGLCMLGLETPQRVAA